MCSSRKYPDPHLPGFSILQGTDGPSPLRNFPKYDKDPPAPLEKFIFTKKDY